ncbi:MAG: cytidine deaminase [Archangium sp.]
MANVDWQKLFEAAETARKKAYAPYSKFQVGAALLCTDGSIVPGCNVENASYGLTVCAERNAIARSVIEQKKIAAVAIVVDSREPTPPCGMCRQVIAEFCDDATPIASRTVSGKEAQWTLGELLPHAFRRSFL